MFFPLFINMENMKVLCIGAGNIGLRRINILKNFNADIFVITKDNIVIDNVSLEIREVAEEDITNKYEMVIAATNNSRLNEKIIEKAKKVGVKYYNNISDKNLCNFYFPAVIENNEITCGLISKNGKSHKTAKEYATVIRNVL